MSNLSNSKKPKILLHICCAACGAYVGELLKKDFSVTLYYCNPNIFPQEEFYRRLADIEMIAEKFTLSLVVENYNHRQWISTVVGHEKEPERGSRCLICYHLRLEQTAKKAKKNNFNFFTTTLTISPHKSARDIFAIGQELEAEYKIKFLAQDFKKQDGAKLANILSRQLNLYRQNYCGCEFSR